MWLDLPKLWSEMNLTTLGVWHFKTVSGHFFTNYTNWGSDCHFGVLNLYKSQFDQNLWPKRHFLFLFPFFNFVRKQNENLWLINGHCMTISGHFFANYMKIFHTTEIQTVILRCILCLNSNWIKSNDIKSVRIFFFMPENASF